MNTQLENQIVFTNTLAIASDGWAQLAPFGDHPGTALLRQADGVVKKFAAIQRLDRAAADGMVEKFKSPWQRLKRYFTGCPIYSGHPDVPAFANDYPDKSSKGMIVDLQVRDDGLYCKPVFTGEGSDLVENKKLRAFSGYWTADLVGEETVAGEPRKIYRPNTLKSAGLTNHPNLPVHLLNEAQPPATPTKTQPKIMNKQLILNFLALHEIKLAADSTDDQIQAALDQLGVELANERRFHRDTLLDKALAAGAITAAQRPDWATRLETDFANTAAALAQLAPVLKTVSLTQNLGARKAEIANATDRRDALDTLVKAEMAINGGDYDRAFTTVQRANPALFSAMKQPSL